MRRRGVLILLSAMLVLLTACQGEEPVKIGFAGQLTGANADIGVQGRDGVLLALEMINERGGAAGRELAMIARDDADSPEGAKIADRELIQAGVVAIIGHMTSGQTIAGLTVTEPAGMIMFSPTASTSLLDRRDDHFFRVGQSTTAHAAALARHAAKERRIERLAVVLDTDNAAYTKSFWDGFSREYLGHGCGVTAEAEFSSTGRPSFTQLLTPVVKGGPGAILVIGSAMDTALIMQRLRILGYKGAVFTSGWAMSEVLLQNAGKAVEGLEVIAEFNPNQVSKDNKLFTERFKKRFGRTPTFAAAQAYEAVGVLAQALEKTGGGSENLKQALLQVRQYQGLSGPISFNEFGDAVRPLYLLRVEKGGFVTVGELGP